MSEQKEKQESVFREESLERIESPEKLNDYLRVTSPGVWIVLSTVIALLIGVFIWGVLGHINTWVNAAVVAEGEETICLVPMSALESVIKNKTIIIDGDELALNPGVLEPQVVSETANVYVLLAGDLSVGDIVYPVELENALPEGIYTGRLVTETISPMSLFFN